MFNNDNALSHPGKLILQELKEVFNDPSYSLEIESSVITSSDLCKII